MPQRHGVNSDEHHGAVAAQGSLHGTTLIHRDYRKDCEALQLNKARINHRHLERRQLTGSLQSSCSGNVLER